jgi:hypothetical protein
VPDHAAILRLESGDVEPDATVVGDGRSTFNPATMRRNVDQTDLSFAPASFAKRSCQVQRRPVGAPPFGLVVGPSRSISHLRFLSRHCACAIVNKWFPAASRDKAIPNICGRKDDAQIGNPDQVHRTFEWQGGGVRMNIRAEIFGEPTERKLIQEKRAKRSDAKGLADIAIQREETRRSNNRDQDRYRLKDALVTIAFEHAEHKAEVVNLSGGGAMIATSLQPKLGDHVRLNLGDGPDGSIECAVRWIKDGRLGLEFAHETELQCTDDDRAALLREVINRDFPDQKFSSRPVVPEVPAATAGAQGAEQRSAMRHPLIWSGDLHHGTHSWHVRLRNVSSSGALVECEGSFRVDSEVLLDLGKAGAFTASVSWAVGDHVGLTFDEPFDLRRLAEAKPRLTPRNWSCPDYLGGDSASSPWDRAWERLSIDDLRTQLEGFLKR